MPIDEPLEVPLSKACYQRLQASHKVATLRLLALNGGIWGVALPLLSQSSIWVALAGAALSVWLLVWSFSVLRENRCNQEGCTRMGKAMKAVWWKGRHYIFSFSNPVYAEMFRSVNELPD